MWDSTFPCVNIDVTMIQTADDSLEQLLARGDNLAKWQAQEITEADTRAKIVDVLLKDILGWQEDCINREQRTADGEYLDYRLESKSNRLILEAKRAGSYFDLPSGASIRARRSGIITRAPGLDAALQQAIGYGKAQGVPVVAVSNGLQIAITLTYGVGGGSQYDTVLFDGRNRLETHFILLWNLLSPSGSAEERLRSFLQARESIRPAPEHQRRLLDVLPLPDEVMDRNPVDVSLAPLIGHYFQDLTGGDRADLLKTAYVESGRQAQYGKQLDALLSDQVPRLGVTTQQVVTTKKKAVQIDTALDLARTESPRTPEGQVILLVGGVGAGKTTFEHRYFEYLIRDDLRAKVLPIFLDFTQVTDATMADEFIDSQLTRQLLDDHAELNLGEWNVILDIYRKEVRDLERGPLAPYAKKNPDRFWELVSDRIMGFMSNRDDHLSKV